MNQRNKLNFFIVNSMQNKIPPIVNPGSFETDSWTTIKNNINSGNTDMYNVGDIKTITLTSDTITPKNKPLKLETTLRVRIANKSTNECNSEQNGFSQTACGFVIEFVDLILRFRMKKQLTNEGGWPASEVYKLLNNETNSIYSVLPPDLQKVIIDTYTVSGHGATAGESNFISNNKLYLLSTKEIWGKDGTDNPITGDTAENETRQLDYYRLNNVTTSTNIAKAIKSYQGNNIVWWLRTAEASIATNFYYVDPSGKNGSAIHPDIREGIAPAFRIG